MDMKQQLRIHGYSHTLYNQGWPTWCVNSILLLENRVAVNANML